jgi:hypothetical protein
LSLSPEEKQKLHDTWGIQRNHLDYRERVLNMNANPRSWPTAMAVAGVACVLTLAACSHGRGRLLDGGSDGATGRDSGVNDTTPTADGIQDSDNDVPVGADSSSTEDGALPDVRDLDTSGDEEGRNYACGQLLADSTALLSILLDPWTGLPYDQIPCGGQYAVDPTGVNPAWGVVPQLPDASITTFSEDATQVNTTVNWSFVDQDPDGQRPSLLYALKIALHLSQGTDAEAPNSFGGLLWHAVADVSRYTQIKIRYRTSTSDSVWQFKLNSGTPISVEPAVVLTGSTTWTDATFTVSSAFPGTDATHLNYLTFAADSTNGIASPVLWIDQISFVADPTRLGDCDVSCPSPLPPYPDLACYEVYTGAVNIANALTFFSTAPAAALLNESSAKQDVVQILTSLESFPGAQPTLAANGSPWSGGGWFQDWHSPTSLMPNPTNRIASLTDEPQLYAALMVVETTWPDLASRAQALRQKLDFSVLYDGGGSCPGTLYGAIDRCAGLQRTWLIKGFGTDSLLGGFLAEASKAAPVCFWTAGLAPVGCALDGADPFRWYSTGKSCMNPAIPASDTGGPFLQLAGLIYLSSEQIPMGTLSLGVSAQNMLRAQYQFATTSGLTLAGWASASDPDACGYMTCAAFTAAKVTPYISGMGASDQFPDTYRMLNAFHNAGADVPLATGTRQQPLGLRDGWDQSNNSGRNSYLYLDTGWMALGLLNGCYDNLVRQRFAQHPVAQAGYALLQASAPACP